MSMEKDFAWLAENNNKKCPNCNKYELEKRIFKEFERDEFFNELIRYNVTYYFCQNCEKWYNEDFYECDEPKE